MRTLPFDYAARNLARRPFRTALAGLSAALVALLVVAATAFVRGVDRGFSAAAPADAAILLSSAAERDVLRSTVSAAVPALVAANVRGVASVGGVPAVSGELQFGTYLRLGGGAADADGAAAAVEVPGRELQAFVRGVTPRAFLVHEGVTLVSGHVPGPGEVLVGRLVAAKLGVPEAALAEGSVVRFEGGAFVVSGTFAAPGSTVESELWADLEELKARTRRDDLSAVFVRLASPEAFEELETFARRRLDLELVAISAATYYRELADYLAPLGRLAWLVALMIGAAALCAGANTLNAAVDDRGRELAVLRTVGYSRAAIALSLATESLLLAAAGGLTGLAAARLALAGAAVRIAMGAFALEVDAAATLAGAGAACALGVLGVWPAARRAARTPIAEALKGA